MRREQIQSPRIRGPKLEPFIKGREGVTMEEGIRRADEAGRVILSNKRLDFELRSNYWGGGNIREGQGIRSGAWIAKVG